MAISSSSTKLELPWQVTLSIGPESKVYSQKFQLTSPLPGKSVHSSSSLLFWRSVSSWLEMMELQVCQTSQLCYSGLYNLTVIPRPRGQKYLSRNSFFIYSLIQMRSSIKMPLIIFQSFLFLMKYSRFINISESEFLKDSQSLCACIAMISMAELMTASFLFLQYLPINGIFSTTLNNSLSMLIEQNNICIVQLFLKVELLLSLQVSLDVQHLMMKRQQGSRNLVLIHQSLLSRGFRCSQISSKQFLLQISKRFAMDIIRIILKWLDVLLSMALAIFLPLVSFSSLRSFQGGTLASRKFSRLRYLSSSVSNSFIRTFIRQKLLQLSWLQIRILSVRQRQAIMIKEGSKVAVIVVLHTVLELILFQFFGHVACWIWLLDYCVWINGLWLLFLGQFQSKCLQFLFSLGLFGLFLFLRLVFIENVKEI